MKKLFLTAIIIAICNISFAWTMQIINTGGDNTGYFKYVQMFHNDNDNHQLICTDPGPTRCSISDWQYLCVTTTEANACMAYAEAQIALGNYSGSFTTSTGILITWSSTSTGGTIINLSKDCN